MSKKPDSIDINDCIFIKYNNKKNEYNVGDVISFIKYDEVITHRIIKKESSIFKTKGDNNKLSDKFNVNKDEIIGNYLGKINIKGNKLLFTKIIPLKLFLIEMITIIFIIKYFLIDGVKRWK